MKLRLISVSRQMNSTTFSRSTNENRAIGQVSNPLPVTRVNVPQSRSINTNKN